MVVMEVDLIREYQRRPYGIEVKAGTTYVSDMLRSLKRFQSLCENPAGAALIYGGSEAAVLGNITTITSYRDTAKLLFPALF